MAEQRVPDPQEPIRGMSPPTVPPTIPPQFSPPGQKPRSGMSTGCMIALILGIVAVLCAGGCGLLFIAGYKKAEEVAQEAGVDLKQSIRSGVKMALQTEPIAESEMTYVAEVGYLDPETGRVREMKKFKGVELGGVGIAVIGFAEKPAEELGVAPAGRGEKTYLLELACESLDGEEHDFDTEFFTMAVCASGLQQSPSGTTKDHQGTVPAGGDMGFPELIFRLPESAGEVNIKIVHVGKDGVFRGVVVPGRAIPAD